MEISQKTQIFNFTYLRGCGKFFALICLLICIFLLTNCRTENSLTQIDTNTREVKDDLGRKVKIPEKIERAVSLAPNLTESIFAVGAGDRLVGVTSFCNYPSEANEIQKVGDTISPN
ncbi:MAG TPA: hypothetical protein VGD05_05495, partial [Pyrinomonadaceae bacterium]